MARFFPATEVQQNNIVDIVEKDAAVFFSTDLDSATSTLMPSIELLVHDNVNGPITQDIAHGLYQSPHQISPDGKITFLSGAREVGLELATCLATLLEVNSKKTLYIPHAYALPAEIESLQDRFGGRVLELAGRVYIRCSGPNVDPELVRQALARMMCGYSVGWLLDRDLPTGKPCSAVVPIFDGEGWAICGESFSPRSRVN
jgi:hypothetical protein